MSLDIDFPFPQGASPLNPLGLSNENDSYYSATSGDLASFYDFPDQGSFDGTTFGMYGGSNGEDLGSPTFSKLDPSGTTCELLSLDELSNSSLGCDNYISSGIGSSLDSLDQDWLIEPVSLPSPEEQDGDIKLSNLSPVPPQTLPLTYQYTPVPVASSSPPLLTPDPSLPSSPLSIHSYSSEEEEIKDVLASFDDSGSCSLDGTAAMTSFASNVMLPLASPSQILDMSPSPTPPPSSSSFAISSPYSPQGSEDSQPDCIRDMLSRGESSNSLDIRRASSASLPSLSADGGVKLGSIDRSRKRKSLPISSSDSQSCAPTPAPKRRLSKASKKERKREQNKTAALRYRQKKKEEKSDVEVRRAELEDKNTQLKAQVSSLSNEINYLKKLWSEICEKRKQLSSSSSS